MGTFIKCNYICVHILYHLSALKKLFSQTAIYGLSSIVARFLNFLLVPFYTRIFLPTEYGIVSEFYAYTGFLGVLLTFGFETGYFRFSKDEKEEKVFSHAFLFLFGMGLLFLALIFLTQNQLAISLHYENNVAFFTWFALILFFDAISAIPFARLRNKEKAFQFAGIKIFEIVLNIALNIFFFLVCKPAYEAQDGSFFASLYSPAIGVGYIFIANLIASLAKFILLLPAFRKISFSIDAALYKKLIYYSLPMVIIGLAGVTNEMLDRVLLPKYLTGTIAENRAETGIYAACYKISIILSLFIQAFRFAAEPFFFSRAKDKNAPALFARVMDYFVLFCCIVFLGVAMNMDFIKYFVGKNFFSGLSIVPILMLANIFLGIYVNLSIWYKLSDKTMMGAWVAIVGAVITIVLNIWWIPIFGYTGSAWATLICYFFMAFISYVLGQKYYPIPYAVFKILLYIGLAVGLLFFFNFAAPNGLLLNKLFMAGIMLGYCLFVFAIERKAKQ